MRVVDVCVMVCDGVGDGVLCVSVCVYVFDFDGMLYVIVNGYEVVC